MTICSLTSVYLKPINIFLNLKKHTKTTIIQSNFQQIKEVNLSVDKEELETSNFQRRNKNYKVRNSANLVLKEAV